MKIKSKLFVLITVLIFGLWIFIFKNTNEKNSNMRYEQLQTTLLKEKKTDEILEQITNSKTQVEPKIPRKIANNLEYTNRLIEGRGPAKVSQFKKQIKQKITSEKIKSHILKMKTARVGDIVLSYDLKAEVIGQVTSSNYLGAYNNFLILKDSGKTLSQGQFYVVYDEGKNAVGFSTGRFIVETDPRFNSKSFERLNLHVSDDSPDSDRLFFVELVGKYHEFVKTQLELSKTEGVKSIRLEIIYSQMRLQ